MALSCIDPNLLPSHVLALYRSEGSDGGTTITACEEECLFQVYSRYRLLIEEGHEERELTALSEIEEMGYDVEVSDAACRTSMHQPLVIATINGGEVFGIVWYIGAFFCLAAGLAQWLSSDDDQHHAPWYMGDIP
ncbi:MAG: hypothetical protein HY465_05245 [Deltaproteobacteria bacterium]|nr:hypothetical protein [Deltaproteobacteria bacterium]